jgi:formate hydrogenlyase subunit 6/NADH:ubiquinone oxidoreductase subunit I
MMVIVLKIRVITIHLSNMPQSPKKVNRPWVSQRIPFERERGRDAFDYNGRKWRKVRKSFMDKEANQLCIECAACGDVTPATVADHEPQATVLIGQGLDPYDEKYLRPLCKQHHNAKSGRERHL